MNTSFSISPQWFSDSSAGLSKIASKLMSAQSEILGIQELILQELRSRALENPELLDLNGLLMGQHESEQLSTQKQSTEEEDSQHTTEQDYSFLIEQISILWNQVQRGDFIDTTKAQRCIYHALDALTQGDLTIVQRPSTPSISTCETVSDTREISSDDSAIPAHTRITPENFASSDETSVWSIHLVLKQAILLAFRFFPCEIQGGLSYWWDKIPLLQNTANRWKREGIRIVPGAFVRHGAYLSPSCIIMPSFINMGAWIGKGTMIDGGAHIGSCAFIGDHCHISANVTIGGVLEPLQALPVIIEDHVFVGAGCHVVEGVHIGQGSVLGAGVILTSSTKIIDRETGEQIQGRIPSYSVLIPGTYATGTHGLSIGCVILAKKTQPGLSPKTALTEALRTNVAEIII